MLKPHKNIRINDNERSVKKIINKKYCNNISILVDLKKTIKTTLNIKTNNS